MHQLTGTRIRTQGHPPGKKRELTFPPVNGVTPEQQQRSRQALITRKHAAQHSVQRIGLLQRIGQWFGEIANR